VPRYFAPIALIALSSATVRSEEVFVTIQRVVGNQIAVVNSPVGRRPGMAGRGPRGAAAAAQPTILVVPPDAKITSAMRERRTNEFRVGVELPGGLRHKVFQDIQGGLQTRLVGEGLKISEINVITDQTDINQSGTSETGGRTVIAVRPKRPPMKRP